MTIKSCEESQVQATMAVQKCFREDNFKVLLSSRLVISRLRDSKIKGKTLVEGERNHIAVSIKFYGSYLKQ